MQRPQLLQSNSYGARSGNDLVMARGPFANLRIVNKIDKVISRSGFHQIVGPITLHVPSGKVLPIYEAAEKYINEGKSTIIMQAKNMDQFLADIGLPRDQNFKELKLSSPKVTKESIDPIS